jgi:hypothetical protein
MNISSGYFYSHYYFVRESYESSMVPGKSISYVGRKLNAIPVSVSRQ